MDHDLLAVVGRHLAAGEQVWLFLDYDGTLVPIARTPDESRPDASLVDLLAGLAEIPAVRVVILSGRPLSFLRAMLPIPGLTLAGTYGIEIQRPGQGVVIRAEPDRIRAVIEQVKSAWTQLAAGRSGFMLEDKGLAVVLHARFADPSDADYVLPQARLAAAHVVASNRFCFLSGDRFLEVAPVTAHKGQTVKWLLNHHAAGNALVIYCGDDDKDEQAFAVVRRRGGIPIIVGQMPRTTRAIYGFDSPDALQGWLRALEKVARERHSLENF